MAEDNKNMFKRNQELEKRRFDVAKMMARNMFNRENEMMRWNREQNIGQPMPGQTAAFLTPKQLFEQNEKNRKIKENSAGGQHKVTLNELQALTSGRLTPAMIQQLVPKGKNIPLDQQIALIANLAKNRGFSPAGESEIETGEKQGGFLGMGAKPVKRKIPVYSNNQFQR